MAETIEIVVNGTALRVGARASLAAALFNAGYPALRRSASGEPRGPLCAMGSCFECRVTVDGVPHRRACLEPVRTGMVVQTGA